MIISTKINKITLRENFITLSTKDRTYKLSGICDQKEYNNIVEGMYDIYRIKIRFVCIDGLTHELQRINTVNPFPQFFFTPMEQLKDRYKTFDE